MTIEERRKRRFSEIFKREQVALIEAGKLSIKGVSVLYEVKVENVRRWVKKYGKVEPVPTILIHSAQEVNRIRDLEHESFNQKRIIGEQQIRILYLEELLRLAKDKLGPDFEKKIKI